MNQKVALLALLAALGFQLGEVLQVTIASPVSKIAEVGEDLMISSASPNGESIAGVSLRQGKWYLCLYNKAGKELARPQEVQAPTGWVNRLSWSSDSQNVAMGGGGQVMVAQLGKKKVRFHKLSAKWQVREVRFRGNHLMARCNDNIFIWETQKWRRVHHLNVPHVIHADMSPDGKLLTFAVFAEGVRVYELDKARVRHHLDNGMTAAFVRLCGDRLVSSYRFRNQRDKDHSVVHSVTSGKPLGKEMYHKELLTCSVDTKGQRLLTRGENCRVIIWDLDRSQKQQEVRIDGTYTDALSPDGHLVATTNRLGNQVKIWRASDGEWLADIPHSEPATWTHFSAPRRLDVTSNSCALWRIKE